METTQRKILSFGRTVGKSRWFIILLFFIGASYLLRFLANTKTIYQDPGRLTLLNLFNAAGFLAFSLSMIYVGVILLKSKNIKSRRLFQLLCIAVIWGGISDLMGIYPWNFVLATFFLIVMLSLSRKSVWELAEKKWAEREQS